MHTEQFSLDMSDTPLPSTSTAVASLPYQSMTDEDTTVPKVSRDTNLPDDTPPNDLPLPPDRECMYGTDVTETESEPDSEPQYMKMYQHFTKSDLKVELKCLVLKDITAKMAKKLEKSHNSETH